MAGADYAHCDLEPCLKPNGSTKVFYDADTDIPAGTVIMHPECAAKAIAEAEARGYQRAIDALRDDDRFLKFSETHPLVEHVNPFGANDLARDYLEASAQTAIQSGESTDE